jgi:hypothetical protein
MEVEHVTHMGDWRGAYMAFARRSDRKSPLQDTSIDRGIILKWMFKKWDR